MHQMVFVYRLDSIKDHIFIECHSSQTGYIQTDRQTEGVVIQWSSDGADSAKHACVCSSTAPPLTVVCQSDYRCPPRYLLTTPAETTPPR